MIILEFQQRSPEWHVARCGKIGGTRLGQLMSTRKNRLVYELLGEMVTGESEQMENDFVSDDMQFGIDNEPFARQMYIDQTGINFREVGLIQSETSKLNTCSPDGLSDNNSVILEIKCTKKKSVHLKRFYEGVDAEYQDQIRNYFVVSNEVQQVHFVSYCPFVRSNPIISKVLNRADFESDILIVRESLAKMEEKLQRMYNEFIF